MDERRVEALVELRHGVAQLREDLPRQIQRGVAAVDRLVQRLAADVLHDDHQLVIALVAVLDPRQVPEAGAGALGGHDGGIGRPHARLALDALANEGPQLGVVGAREADHLSGLVRSLLQHADDAVARVALEGVQV